MKRSLILILLLSFTSIAFAGEINKATAKKVARNFFYERISQFSHRDYQNIITAEVYELKTAGKTLIYAVNIYGGGFVLVSASDLVRTVPGYSLTGKYTDLGLPPQFSDLINQYKLQIHHSLKQKEPANLEIMAMWDRLMADDPSKLKPLSREKAVEPMLTTTWDQGQYYNEMCPYDQSGPGNHCYTGCVATALGQLVNYFRWPEQGTGSYTYECPPYGTLTADFGNTSYEYNNMPTQLSGSNLPTALLLYHLGISCDMVYGPNGSGMYNHKAAYALRTFFKYSPETVYVYRDSTSMDWDSLLISHLDRSIPMYYAGWSVPNINGHAFICDGYQADFYYHFNWGWSGSYDGYFYTANLNPGGSNFNLAQELIINAFPDTNLYSYPVYCQENQALTSTKGTIDDGSGPVYDYESNTDCSWLIAPDDSVNSISIAFLKFNTDANDVLSIYDGASSTAPLLGSFQGQSIPTEVTSTGDKLFITFTSNGNGTASGWLLSYTSDIPDYCSGMVSMLEQTGSFGDGSGPRDYHNGTACMWKIDPPGASELSLYFDSFDTEEDYDLFKVYDFETQELLAEYSGSNLPPAVSSPSGRMFITWSTNSTITAPGWQVYYETDLVNVKENHLDENLQIYPNPAINQVNLSWMAEKNGTMTVTVSTMTGNKLIDIKSGSQKGLNELKLDVSSIPAGIYLLKLNAGHERVYRKIVVR